MRSGYVQPCGAVSQHKMQNAHPKAFFSVRLLHRHSHLLLEKNTKEESCSTGDSPTIQAEISASPEGGSCARTIYFPTFCFPSRMSPQDSPGLSHTWCVNTKTPCPGTFTSRFCFTLLLRPSSLLLLQVSDKHPSGHFKSPRPATQACRRMRQAPARLLHCLAAIAATRLYKLRSYTHDVLSICPGNLHTDLLHEPSGLLLPL